MDAASVFCHNCGSKQAPQQPGAPGMGGRAGAAGARPAAPPTGPAADILHGVNERTASVLCYVPVFGIIPAIVFLASQKFRRNARVRFDAFQSLYLFVAWLILSAVVPVMFFGLAFEMARLAKLVMVLVWVLLLVRASRDEPTRLPVLGDLAARSAAEQS